MTEFESVEEAAKAEWEAEGKPIGQDAEIWEKAKAKVDAEHQEPVVEPAELEAETAPAEAPVNAPMGRSGDVAVDPVPEDADPTYRPASGYRN